jgi:hypothetical protein
MFGGAREYVMKNKKVKALLLMGLLGAGCAGGTALYLREANAMKLDATTAFILANADKVEALRLNYYGGPSPDFSDEKRLYDPTSGYILRRPARVVNTNFAPRLLAALRSLPVQKDREMVECFDPGVGFRVWRGGAWTQMFICFRCQGIEISAVSEEGKKSVSLYTDLGSARKTLLALSREAFPDDEELKDVKDTQ